MATLFDPNQYHAIFRCNECDEPHPSLSEAEDCCYVNEDCPELCGTRHAPRPDRPDRPSRLAAARSMAPASWECPGTERVWEWCHGCGWVNQDEERQWDNGPIFVVGYWYCGAEYHEIGNCDNCGDYAWYEDMHYSEYHGYRCSRCGPSGGSMAPSESPRCDDCGDRKRPTKIHPLTERVLCADCTDSEAVAIEIAIA